VIDCARPRLANAARELRDRITVFREVSPHSTKIDHSFYYERPQARRARDAREAAGLLEQARAAFRALRAAAVAAWIVKAAISNTPRTVKTLFRILVSMSALC
jgi:hypothetical protein